MPLPPETTPVPTHIFAPAMTPSTSGPPATKPTPSTSSASSSASSPDKAFPLPRLRMHFEDVAHAGTAILLSLPEVSSLLARSAQQVHEVLYRAPDDGATHAPATRSVTLIARAMPGQVAYTTGTDLDPLHKEVHLSLSYVAGVEPPARRAAEVAGVVLHELVHCFQHSAPGAPSGLVEGVADFVRLRCGLAPPHWRRPGPHHEDLPARWDAGYQHTAYFLRYLETRFGAGTVRRLNEALRTAPRYEERAFWTGLLGWPVGRLWEDYKDAVKNGDGVRVVQTDEEEGGAVDEGTQT
ncbi:plant basic secretory protein [Xylariomycetidae sp. FL0641]|nr:plant basic secretory protein [Xylariomycetidae sp. FL0641]